MKILLQFTFTFFYYLITAAPIPSQYRIVHAKDYLYCASAACPPSQLITSIYKANTPPKAFLNVNFSSYQIINPSTRSAVAHQASEHTFTNTQFTTPEHLKQSHALSAEVSLQSSYLLSIVNPAIVLLQQGPLPKVVSPTDALAAKPTSALLYSRKADAIRHWANVRSGSSPDKYKRYDKVVATDGPVMSGSTRTSTDEFSLGGIYCRVLMFVGRGYSDLLICGILVLFVIGAIALEAAEMVSDMLLVYGRRQHCGRVYSGHNEKAAQTRYNIVVNEHGVRVFDTEVEGFV